jgi:hypothetical protein
MRGTCQKCGRRYQVSYFGYVYEHESRKSEPGIWCVGAWKPAAEVVDIKRKLDEEHDEKVKRAVAEALE